MDPIERIEAKLRRFPSVRLERRGSGLTIRPPDSGGFPITIVPENGEWIVAFGDAGMHEHFEDPEDAIDFVGFGLSDRRRLREIRCYGFLCRSLVEKREGGQWKLVFETGTLTFPRWHRRAETVRQNRLISDP